MFLGLAQKNFLKNFFLCHNVVLQRLVQNFCTSFELATKGATAWLFGHFYHEVTKVNLLVYLFVVSSFESFSFELTPF